MRLHLPVPAKVARADLTPVHMQKLPQLPSLRSQQLLPEQLITPLCQSPAHRLLTALLQSGGQGIAQSAPALPRQRRPMRLHQRQRALYRAHLMQRQWGLSHPERSLQNTLQLLRAAEFARSRHALNGPPLVTLCVLRRARTAPVLAEAVEAAAVCCQRLCGCCAAQIAMFRRTATARRTRMTSTRESMSQRSSMHRRLDFTRPRMAPMQLLMRALLLTLLLSQPELKRLLHRLHQ